MNLKSVVSALVIIIVIVIGVKIYNDSQRNELSRSLDQAADNIEEGLNDAERGIKDALD